MVAKLEIFFITFSQGFYYSYPGIRDLELNTNPDDMVLELALSKGFNKDKLISHSTSWRYSKAEDSIVLTYIVFQTDIYLEDVRLVKINKDKISHGSSYHPSPEKILIEEVLMHGLRHLEFLINEHEVKVAPQLEEYLKPLRIDLAGKIKDFELS